MSSARHERGIALIFALGLLFLLLCVGLAFVGNALVNRKVARNNSARTQAKLLARSVISRAAASIMLYQGQLMQKAPAELLSENYSHICSFGNGSDAVVLPESLTEALHRKLLTDGLLGDKSLMLLPEDDTSVSKSAAASYNARFKSGSADPWQGNWVYFYNSASGSDRRIIGRAAWQVISSPAQILAPVFFRGHLCEVPGKVNYPSNMCRWGRDIFEVDLYGTRRFPKDKARPDDDIPQIYADYDGYRIEDFEICINKKWIAAENDGDRRWLERWFVLDPNPALGENAAWEPNATPLVPETYIYQPENKSEKRQLCRFNISDLYTPAMTEQAVKEKYGVSAEADPWYARFRIDSTSSNEINSEKVLEELTRDSARFAYHNYDYELTEASLRSGLPFLRRIGADKGTFGDIIALRKQIAANFNDYCDADSVPTSDVSARLSSEQNWLNAEPNFTGNEKTPYFYEFGALTAFVRNPASSVSDAQPGIGCTLSPNTGTAARRVELNFGLRLSPVVKLADLYGFEESRECRNLQAKMDFSEIALAFKITQITLNGIKIRYRSGSRYYNKSLDNFTVSVSALADYPSLNALGLADGLFSVALTGNEIVSGEALNFATQDGNRKKEAYPLRYFSQNGADACCDTNSAIWHAVTPQTIREKLKFNGNPVSLPTLKLSTEEVLKLAAARNALPDSYSDFAVITQPTELLIDRVQLTSFSLLPRRLVLTAERELKQGATERYGVDYVREFQKIGKEGGFTAFFWSSEAGKELCFVNAPRSGILFGGIRNYDPRQNLNNADWYPYPEAGETQQKAMPKLTVVENYLAPTDAEISSVIRKEQVNCAYDGSVTAFAPSCQEWDCELAAEPARTSQSAISTAVIRNAPMMSPWEIGMIHRGAKWQTINLKNSSSPTVANSPVRPSDYAANGESWDAVGTTYEGGDAALLDQIKMCQLGSTYGKINLNMLWRGDPEFDALRDADIFRALFEGVCYGENTSTFIGSSTRDAAGFFVGMSSGTGQISVPDTENLTSFNKLTDPGVAFPKTEKNQPGSRRYASRAQFVDYLSGTASLANGFGLVPEAEQIKDDAHFEEIIGKTVNLLTAETSAPDRICLVALVQIIFDCAGMHYLISEGSASNFTATNGGKLQSGGDGLLAMECRYGRFDAAIHQNDPDKNLYFDEIIGEVKLFVSLKRDPETGRITLEQINYIE